jgi:hypothetical protein
LNRQRLSLTISTRRLFGVVNVGEFMRSGILVSSVALVLLAGCSTSTGSAAPSPSHSTPAVYPSARLGSAFDRDAQGFGSVAPAAINLGNGGTGMVWNIVWKHWGTARAIGHGSAYWVPATALNEDNAVKKPATLYAWGLVSCAGHLAYEHVGWYFPAQGEKWNPSQDDLYTSYDLCVSDYQTPAPPKPSPGAPIPSSAVDAATHLVFDTGHGFVMWTPAAPKKITRLPMNSGEPAWSTASGRYVYWTQTMQGRDALVREGVRGGPVQVVVRDFETSETLRASGNSVVYSPSAAPTLVVAPGSKPRTLLMSTSVEPLGFAFDGRTVWFSDGNDNTIKSIDVNDPNTVTVVAHARLNPGRVATDGKYLFWTDDQWRWISRMDLATGQVEPRWLDVPGVDPNNLVVAGGYLYFDWSLGARFGRIGVDGNSMNLYVGSHIGDLIGSVTP